MSVRGFPVSVKWDPVVNALCDPPARVRCEGSAQGHVFKTFDIGVKCMCGHTWWQKICVRCHLMVSDEADINRQHRERE